MAGPVDPAFVEAFCARFDPVQARFAPARGKHEFLETKESFNHGNAR
jgi:hypothetical protein